MDQELADAATFAPDKCCVCTHQMAALFCVKCYGRHLESTMSYQKSDSVNRCIFTSGTILLFEGFLKIVATVSTRATAAAATTTTTTTTTTR